MADVQEALNVDPCDPKGLREKLEDLFEDFYSEVRDTILEIATNFLGPFIITFATLFAQLSSAAVLNLASMLASAIIGGVLGSVIALVNLSLSLVNGAKIMLKYLAVKSLRRFLEGRIKFIESLTEDVNQFLNLLRALDSISIERAETIFLDDIDLALPHVKRALRLIGRENGKVKGTTPGTFTRMGSQASVDNEQLDIAVEEISKAISALTGGQAEAFFSERISDINEKYGIEIDDALNIEGLDFDVPNPTGLINYFENAVKQLKADGSNERVRAYILEFLGGPEISEFLRDYASTLFLKSRIDSLGKRLPVRSYVLTNLGKKGAKKLLDTTGIDAFNEIADWKDRAKSKINSLFEYLNVSGRGGEVVYADDGFQNFAAASEAVQSAQAAVLLQDDWFNLIEAESNVVKVFLDPAVDKLKGVKQEMVYVQETGITDLEQKIGWMAELAMAKTLTQSTISPSIGFASGQRMSGREIQNRFRGSLEIYDELTQKIIGRVLEEVGPNNFESVEPLSDRVLNAADEYLSSFFLGPAAMFNPSERAKVIKGLQAIRVGITEIRARDESEMFLCDEFLNSVERNPIFNSVIVPAWDAFIDSLEDIPLLTGVVDGMKSGDLSKLVNSLATAKYAIDEVEEVADCINERATTDPLVDAQAEALSKATGVSKSVQRTQIEENQNKITSLKSKLAKLESMEALLD